MLASAGVFRCIPRQLDNRSLDCHTCEQLGIALPEIGLANDKGCAGNRQQIARVRRKPAQVQEKSAEIFFRYVGHHGGHRGTIGQRGQCRPALSADQVCENGLFFCIHVKGRRREITRVTTQFQSLEVTGVPIRYRRIKHFSTPRWERSALLSVTGETVLASGPIADRRRPLIDRGGLHMMQMDQPIYRFPACFN